MSSKKKKIKLPKIYGKRVKVTNKISTKEIDNDFKLKSYDEIACYTNAWAQNDGDLTHPTQPPWIHFT